MQKTAAALCKDPISLRAIQTAVSDLGIALRACPTSQAALELVLSGQCCTLIVDFDLAGAEEVIRMASLLPPPQRPALLAVASRAWPGTGQAFQSGASRILYRPLDAEQLKEALRPTKKANASDRQSVRFEMKTLVYLEIGSYTLPAISIDISEHGMALQAAEPVPIQADLPFRCALPGGSFELHGHADVMWASDQGRAGLFFSKMAPAARKHLKEWLGKRSVHRKDKDKDKDALRELLPPDGAQVAFARTES